MNIEEQVNEICLERQVTEALVENRRFTSNISEEVLKIKSITDVVIKIQGRIDVAQKLALINKDNNAFPAYMEEVKKYQARYMKAMEYLYNIKSK